MKTFLFVLGCAFSPLAFAARPAAPVITVQANEIKQLAFDWQPIAGVNTYQLWFKAEDGASWVKYMEKAAPRTSMTISVSVHLLNWPRAYYQLKACNASGCSTSNSVRAINERLVAMGYLKPDTSTDVTYYGAELALSADGTTLAVQSGELVNGNAGSVVVYVYRRTSVGWRREARLVPSSASPATQLGDPITLSANGNVLAVGTAYEDAPGGTPREVGAVYLFRRDGSTWREAQKISGQSSLDNFGDVVRLDDAGQTLVISHTEAGVFRYEEGTLEVYRAAGGSDQFVHDRTLNVPVTNGQPHGCGRFTFSGDGQSLLRNCSDSTARQTYVQVLKAPGFSESSRVNTPQGQSSPDVNFDGSVFILQNSGAAVVYRLGPGGWAVDGYLSSFGGEDYGGPRKVAISRDGKIAAIGSPGDVAAGPGPIFPPYATAEHPSGAAIIHERKSSGWVLRRLVKPGSGGDQWAGWLVALGDNGRVLAVGAPRESSGATGIDGDRTDESAPISGAVWLY